MNIELIRKEKYGDRTIGSIYVDGSFECFSLEDADRELENGGVKIPGKTAIPRGKYRVIIDWSDRFKCLMLHVLDVPQFTGIRIHAGNRPEDTEEFRGQVRYHRLKERFPAVRRRVGSLSPDS